MTLVLWQINVVMMMSLKQLMVMKKGKKTLVKLSRQWLPGVVHVFAYFAPSWLVCGVEAGEEDGREG